MQGETATKPDSAYRAYLLRLRWIDPLGDKRAEWRISLEEAGSGHEIFYTTLDALFIYLSSQLYIIDDNLPSRFKYKEGFSE